MVVRLPAGMTALAGPAAPAPAVAALRGSRGRVTTNDEPPPEAAVDDHPAAVHVDDRLDDRQAQAAAAAARLVGQRAAVEALEDPGQLGRVDPHPVVADLDLGAALDGPHVDVDRAAGRP